MYSLVGLPTVHTVESCAVKEDWHAWGHALARMPPRSGPEYPVTSNPRQERVRRITIKGLSGFLKPSASWYSCSQCSSGAASNSCNSEHVSSQRHMLHTAGQNMADDSQLWPPFPRQGSAQEMGLGGQSQPHPSVFFGRSEKHDKLS